MPKTNTNLLFEPLALLKAALEQDFGLWVSTNNPEGFKRVMYQHMSAAPHLRCRIFASPVSKSLFALLKPSVSTTATELGPNAEETTDEQAEG